MLREGQVAGGIRPDINTEAAAWWLLSMVATRAFRTAAMPDPGELEADLTATTLAALTTAPPPGASPPPTSTPRPTPS